MRKLQVTNWIQSWQKHKELIGDSIQVFESSEIHCGRWETRPTLRSLEIGAQNFRSTFRIAEICTRPFCSRWLRIRNA
jgi:hypothetical protein